MLPKVYIIIVNHKGHEDTIECLESVLKLSYGNFKVLVIDNSQDKKESLDYIVSWAKGIHRSKSLFPEIVYPSVPKPISYRLITEDNLPDKPFNENLLLFHMPINKGFAHANNVGIRYAIKAGDFEFIWLLNNDTIATRDALSELVKHYKERETKVGIVGSKLLYYFKRDTIQAVGGTYNKWFGVVRELGRGIIDSNEREKKKFKIDYVIGASMLIGKNFISEVGLMNEKLFLYFEELDWALRGQRKGYTLDYCNSSKIYHKVGASIIKKERYSSELSDFYAIRNKILITKNYFNNLSLLTVYFSFIYFIINRIKRGQWSRIKTLWMAIRDAKKTDLLI